MIVYSDLCGKLQYLGCMKVAVPLKDVQLPMCDPGCICNGLGRRLVVG